MISGQQLATKPWIRARVRLYARRLRLGYSPEVRFERLAGVTQGSAHQAGVIKVDLSNHHVCRHEIDETAAHEVVHLVWPKLRHGRSFEAVVNAVRTGLYLP